jgi:hypothetical protein
MLKFLKSRSNFKVKKLGYQKFSKSERPVKDKPIRGNMSRHWQQRQSYMAT